MSNRQLSAEKGPRAASADFCGVNNPIKADFRQPIGSHLSTELESGAGHVSRQPWELPAHHCLIVMETLVHSGSAQHACPEPVKENQGVRSTAV